MTPFHRRTVPLTAAATGLAAFVLAGPGAWAGDPDRDGDRMPNRWETRHGLNPDRANAQGDADRDGLSNRGEFRRHGDPQDEDSDDDGDDDGDEVHDDHGGDVDDADSDDDGTEDGDEDHDDDGTDNEDEDDAEEPCARDDDDSDRDDVADEDENDHGSDPDDRDSDDDGTDDGDEDHDEDGQSDEDDDDSDDDSCEDSEEDSDDLLGVIAAYDAESGSLDITLAEGAGTVTFVVTDETEIEWDEDYVDSPDGDDDDHEVGPEALVPGTTVTEVDVEDDGTLEEIELVPPMS